MVRIRPLVTLAAAAAVAGLAAPAVAAPAPHALQLPSPAGRWAVDRPACAKPAPGRLACFALVRKNVPAGTPHAYRYTPLAVHGPSGGYTPAALARAYGVSGHVDNRVGSQVVAVIGAYSDPHLRAELNAFDAHYHVRPGGPGTAARESGSSLQRVDQRGSASSYPDTDRGWATEQALDVEAVRAMCHRCRIRMVEADGSSASELAKAVDTAVTKLHATVVTNSYGGVEAGATVARRTAYQRPGVVMVASTGDDGWYSWDGVNLGYSSADQPNVPSAYPGVVAVGGTKLVLKDDGTRASEHVWNRNGADDRYGLERGPLGASGGGCSRRYAAPAYQRALAGYARTGCAGKRMVGDVAADADPATGMDVYSYYLTGTTRGTWGTVGGTSLSAPLIAGMWALAGGAHGRSDATSLLYDNRRQRPSSLFDVTVGSNAFCGAADRLVSKPECSAAVRHLAGISNPNGLYWASDGSQVGELDCGYRLDGSRGRLSSDRQCHAGTGYDGPTGVGTPRGLAGFRPVP